MIASETHRCGREPREYCSEYAGTSMANPSGQMVARCSNCYQALYESDGGYCPLCEMVTPDGHDPFESPAEALFWLAWVRARGGYTQHILKPQHWVSAGGHNFRMDFAIPDIKLNVEIDGRLYHTSPEDRARDSLRDALLRQDGWRIVRFTGSQVSKDADCCAQSVLRYAGLPPG